MNSRRKIVYSAKKPAEMGHKQLVNQGHHLKLTSYNAKFIVGMSNPSSVVLVTKDL